MCFGLHWANFDWLAVPPCSLELVCTLAKGLSMTAFARPIFLLTLTSGSMVTDRPKKLMISFQSLTAFLVKHFFLFFLADGFPIYFEYLGLLSKRTLFFVNAHKQPLLLSPVPTLFVMQFMHGINQDRTSCCICFIFLPVNPIHLHNSSLLGEFLTLSLSFSYLRVSRKELVFLALSSLLSAGLLFQLLAFLELAASSDCVCEEEYRLPFSSASFSFFLAARWILLFSLIKFLSCRVICSLCFLLASLHFSRWLISCWHTSGWRFFPSSSCLVLGLETKVRRATAVFALARHSATRRLDSTRQRSFVVSSAFFLYSWHRFLFRSCHFKWRTGSCFSLSMYSLFTSLGVFFFFFFLLGGGVRAAGADAWRVCFLSTSLVLWRVVLLSAIRDSWRKN